AREVGGGSSLSPSPSLRNTPLFLPAAYSSMSAPASLSLSLCRSLFLLSFPSHLATHRHTRKHATHTHKHATHTHTDTHATHTHTNMQHTHTHTHKGTHTCVAFLLLTREEEGTPIYKKTWG